MGLRPNMDPSTQALLLSQGGVHASKFLQAIPKSEQFTLSNPVLQCLLRRRLRLPLVDGLSHCPGKTHKHADGRFPLDEFGDHLCACMVSGRVQRRANLLEKAWAQVFREAGGTVVLNEKLANMRIGVHSQDKRRLEFAVYNLQYGRGIPLLCDATMVSPLTSNGIPRPKACTIPGVCLEEAEKPKQRKYHEATQNGRVQLVTLACEVGGRWSPTCINIVTELAKHKASVEPFRLRRAVEFGWHARWWSLLSVTAQRAVAVSLLAVEENASFPSGGFAPSSGDVVADARYEVGPVVSRLPLRS